MDESIDDEKDFAALDPWLPQEVKEKNEAVELIDEEELRQEIELEEEKKAEEEEKKAEEELKIEEPKDEIIDMPIEKTEVVEEVK